MSAASRADPIRAESELDVTWTVDGEEVTAARGRRFLDLKTIERKVSRAAVSVSDPTPFVRDPAVRTKALTASRFWQIVPGLPGDRGGKPAFTASSATDRAAG